ncbi:hypothetical protein SteCoe_25610 [Stentor coeruleus]|uniref:Uncharacterized protein n=1 Tax=Stentor coeruleus TaxID=5963 RepID=A0A1R2BEV5_9CILI|nr:hypothetical protein SteCoe_25610 [Stentor coeruleus]
MEELTNRKAEIFRREQENMRILSATYGSALPFQLLMERNVLSQKPHGIQNINIGLDVSLGRNTELPFPHYLDNRPTCILDINRNNISLV